MNVLLIAYYYPPINSGGTERPLKMAKYLPQFGHKTIVLTHSYTKNALTNPLILRIYDPSHNTHRKGRYWGKWLGLRLFVECINLCGMYSSIYSWWKQSVLKHSADIIFRSKPDILLATYPPVEDLEIALNLSEHYKIPLVTDFRDGLLFEPIEQRRIGQYPCIRDEYRRIEHDTAQKSSTIITAFPQLTEYFRNTYVRKNVYTLPNGCDIEEFQDLPETITLEPEKFHIVHTGRFGGSYAGRNIMPFVTALRQLVTQHSEMRRTLRVHLVGVLGKWERHTMGDLIKEGTIVYYGQVDRKTALAFQRKANLLLLLTSVDRKGAVPGKLFEYLYAGRPILALTFQSYAEDILARTKTGWVIHPEHSDQIYQLLYQLITNKKFYHSLHPSTPEIARFSRAQQMNELSTILHNSMQEPPSAKSNTH